MSNAELVPLFPSATHPALPIATQILSTLRSLTAPGRGNDIRPEERAALVGVSALLGCERVQSKDLIESSAQKASSVSPAHFRSALQHARRILRTTDSDPQSPSRTRSDRSSSNATASTSNPTPAVPSPFQTPKKKFKFSSGIDISGLVVKSPHSPAQSSPLKNSVTPSRLRGDEKNTDGDGEVERTPTKRVKYGVKQGVDLEAVSEERTATGRRKGQGVEAFFAMRPGGSEPVITRKRFRGVSPEKGVGVEVLPRVRREEVERPKQKEKRRRDWTFAEALWDRPELQAENQKILAKVWKDLPLWLESHDRPLPQPKSQPHKTLLDLLLASSTLSATPFTEPA